VRYLKYLFAKFVMSCMRKKLRPDHISEETAKKWNHVQGLILSRGAVKFRKDLLWPRWFKNE